MTRKEAIGWAQIQYSNNDDVEIDENAKVNKADYGMWVAAWVWVPTEEA